MFDSSRLTIANCYAQRFTMVGTFPYRLVGTDVVSAAEPNYPFTITITPAQGGTTQQHNITVTMGKEGLVAEPAELTIGTGDMVLWNTPDKSIQGFAVEVKLPALATVRSLFLELPPDQAAAIPATGSLRMHNNAFFTHAFGLPGDYVWQDANGGKARGVIHVRTLSVKSEADRKAWLDKLAEGVGISIQGDSVDKPEVEILVGQTVVWSIDAAPGIRLAAAAAPEPGSQDPTIS